MRRRSALIAVVGVCALALSGCAYFLPAAQEHQLTSPDTRPWWCHSADMGHGGHGSDAAMAMKGMLSWDDCLSVSDSFDKALAYAQQWPTLADAEAAGFHNYVNYWEGMGTHHARDLSPAFDGHFKPWEPTFLQYASDEPDARLVGMSWYVKRTADAPPYGFPGDNDVWHTHEYLCFDSSNTVIDENLTDEECAAQGGHNMYLGETWMLHAWIVPGTQYFPDVFIGHHPCLQETGLAPLEDPCWTEAVTPNG